MTKVPYPDGGMPSSQARFPAPSTRFLIELFGLSASIGIALVVFDAALWLFYIAPFAAVPLLVRELRALDSSYEPQASDNLATRSHSGENQLEHEDKTTTAPKDRPNRGQAVVMLLLGILLVALILVALQRGEFGESSESSHGGGGGEAHTQPSLPSDHHKAAPPSQSPGAAPPRSQGYAEVPIQPGRGHSQSPPEVAAEPPREPSPSATASPPRREATPHQTGAQPAETGGSSPLVPILIAIAALATISVAVVMVRQRRQRGREGARHRFT